MLMFISALLGFSSIVLAAFIDHSFRFNLSNHAMHSLSIAVQYQQINSIFCFCLCLLADNIPKHLQKLFKRCIKCLLTAIIIFCCSIYLDVFAHMKFLSHITPIGGILFIFAWLYFGYFSLQYHRT